MINKSYLALLDKLLNARGLSFTYPNDHSVVINDVTHTEISTVEEILTKYKRMDIRQSSYLSE
jgi:hypothetical protein